MSARPITPSPNGKTTLRTFTTTLTLLLLTVGFLAIGLTALADEAEDEYLRIFDLIQQADASHADGNMKAAIAKYQAAQGALIKLQRAYPDYQRKMMAYRLKYVADKIVASSPPAPPPAKAPATTAVPGDADAASPRPAGTLSDTQVKLLDAGTEPRRILRLQPKEGDKQTLTMSMKMRIVMKMGEMELPASELPLMKLVMDTSISSISPEGDITYELVMTDATVQAAPGAAPEVVEAMKSSIVSMQGLSGKGIISNRGITKAMEVKPPSGADPQSRQAVEQMTENFSRLAVPFPEEALGRGAKWEVKMPLKSQGMLIQQTSIYELSSVEGDLLTAKSTGAQTAGKQKIENPAMPGQKIDLMKMAGNATGEVSLDLTRLLPQKGTVKFHSDTTMGVDIGGQLQTMDMKMDMDLALEAR